MDFCWSSCILVLIALLSGIQNDDRTDTFIDVETIKQEVQDISDDDDDDDDDDFICVEDEGQYSVCSKGRFRSSLEFVEVKHELPYPDRSERSENNGVWSEGNFGPAIEYLEVKQELRCGEGTEETHNDGYSTTTSRRPQRAASRNVLKAIGEIFRDEEETEESEENGDRATRTPPASHEEGAEEPEKARKYRNFRERNNEASRRSRLLRRQRIAQAEAEVARLEQLLPALRARAQKLEAVVAELRRAVAAAAPHLVEVASAEPGQSVSQKGEILSYGTVSY